jgi:putative endonuclease
MVGINPEYAFILKEIERISNRHAGLNFPKDLFVFFLFEPHATHCHPEQSRCGVAKDLRTMNGYQASKTYFTYIVTNKYDTVLYTGFTGEINLRMYQHKYKIFPGFTAKYNAHKLVWYETFSDPNDGIAAEKRIKGWKRERKIALIKSKNPEFRDLMADKDDGTFENTWKSGDPSAATASG